MSQKSADAYLRSGGRVYIRAISETVAGVGISSGPPFVAALDKPEDIASALQEALQYSKPGVPHPSREKLNHIFDPVLAIAGVGSWRTFSKGARCVDIRVEGDSVRLIPTRNLWPRGFEELLERGRVIALSSSELGNAVIEAFDAAE